MRDLRVARALAPTEETAAGGRWITSILLVALFALLTFGISALRATSAFANDDDDDAVTSSRTEDDDDDGDEDDGDRTGTGGTGGDDDTSAADGTADTGADGTGATGATGETADDETVADEITDNQTNDEVLGLRINRGNAGGTGGDDVLGAGLPAAAETEGAATPPFTVGELASFVLSGAGLIGAGTYLARRRKA